MKRIVCLIICILLCGSVALAHPGRTDAKGGHYDRSTGEYHFHHGYPAHQHINGECPYDLDDRTGDASGGSSGTGQGNRPADKDPLQWEDVGAYLVLLFCGLVFFMVVFEPDQRKSKKPSVHAPAPLPPPTPKQDGAAERYRAIYEGKSVRELADVPGWAYFDERDLPHTLICEGEEDPFEVFVTSSGSSYHRRGCRLAGNARPVNICVASSMGRCACKVCQPMQEIPAFVGKFREIRKIQRKYQIDMEP